MKRQARVSGGLHVLHLSIMRFGFTVSAGRLKKTVITVLPTINVIFASGTFAYIAGPVMKMTALGTITE